MTKQEILKEELMGFELFPNTPSDEVEMMTDSIYRAMDRWAEHKAENVSKSSVSLFLLNMKIDRLEKELEKGFYKKDFPSLTEDRANKIHDSLVVAKQVLFPEAN